MPPAAARIDTVDALRKKLYKEKNMQEIFKTYDHNPPHLFRNSTKYFITGAIYEKKQFMREPDTKIAVIKYMFTSFAAQKWQIEEWVVMNNHYHLLADAAENADALPLIINNFHKFSAIWIRKHVTDSANANPIFYNYWDTCIDFEKSYYIRINYIWNNPVKHGKVSDPKDWLWGSYINRMENITEVNRILKNYPSDKAKVYDDF